MTSLLPPNLLRLFAPRPPPLYLKPLTKDERDRGPNKLGGVGSLIKRIREEADDEEIRRGKEEDDKRDGEPSTTAATAAAVKTEPVNGNKMDVDEDGEVKDIKKSKQKPKKKDPVAEAGVVGQEAVKMRRELRKKRQEEYKKNLESNYRPQDDPEAAGDPYKTLFIARLSKKATEADLRREFEMYGAIERIRIVRDRKGKSNSYAFIVYERERDMKAAYKDAEGIPIHHKKILVDVERGRTVKGWKPRKLGGGLGGRPKPVDPEKAQVAPAFGPPGGGFRGGFRGGRGGGGGFRGGPPGGGGFRGGGGGGFRGGRGGFGDGGGGFQGGRGGFGGGGRGGFQGGGGGDSGYGDRGGGGGGGFGGRGGYGGGGAGGFGGGSNGFQQGGAGGGAGGYGGGGGFKRDFEGGGGGGAPGGYGGGGYGGGGGGGGGYEDRDSKRMRY